MKKLILATIFLICFSVASSVFASDVGVSPTDNFTYQVPALVVAHQTPALNVDYVTVANIDQEAMYSYKLPIYSLSTITAGNDAYFAYMDTHRRICNVVSVNNNKFKLSVPPDIQNKTAYEAYKDTHRK